MNTTLVKSNGVTLASELLQVQQELSALADREKGLKHALLESLKSQGVDYVKMSNGYGYKVVSGRVSLTPKKGKEDKAQEWAQEHNCLKIDTSKALEILRHELKTPSFFVKKYAEDYLAIVNPKPVR